MTPIPFRLSNKRTAPFKKSMAEVKVTWSEYGKDDVRLMRVRRDGDKYFVTELKVNTRLQLSSTKDYESGDNSDVVATDSQKNTVLVLAKQNNVRCPLPFCECSCIAHRMWAGLICAD